MANFYLTNLAVNMLCKGNVAQVDDTGLPSILVYIPAFKNSDVLNSGSDSTHPAFIVNGKEIPGFYYSKYQNCVHNGVAYSLPGEDPQVVIKLDPARECCETKGNGWHLSTNAEWAAIALWCKKNGFLPYGNNNYGKDILESNYRAIPVFKDSNGRTARVATGTGPLSWSHDKTLAGIWDMNGNVWEWQSGLRLVWGELQILANNDAADPDNPQNETSTCWKAINASDGALVTPECKTTDASATVAGETVRLDFVNNKWTYTTQITNTVTADTSCKFSEVTCTSAISEATKALLRSLALLPDEGANEADYDGDRLWSTNNNKEAFVVRGSAFTQGENSGVFATSIGYERTYKTNHIGFRAAYIPEID